MHHRELLLEALHLRFKKVRDVREVVAQVHQQIVEHRALRVRLRDRERELREERRRVLALPQLTVLPQKWILRLHRMRLRFRSNSSSHHHLRMLLQFIPKGTLHPRTRRGCVY